MASLKLLILKTFRRKVFQPAWEALAHLSKVGQNYWSTSIPVSGETEVLRSLPVSTECVVFDVGSNIGDYTLEVVKHLKPKTVHAFEPSVAAYAELVRNIRRYGLGDVVKPHRLALGAQVGQATLHSSEAGASIGSLLPLRNPFAPFQEEHNEEVEVGTIDEFCRDKGIDRIDLLKVDVEGFELSVLQGASRMIKDRRVRFIQFEFGSGHIDARTYLRDFFDILSQDYDIFRIVSDGLRKIPIYRPEIEVFATINYFASLKTEV